MSIVIEAYNPRWHSNFEALRLLYQASLPDLLLAVEHVGSTAVVGLAAKPILDIDLVVTDEAAMQEVISKLALLGYQHQGNLGISGREAFKLSAEHMPQSAGQKAWPAHHLYACVTGSTALRNHLLFRDYLRTHRAKVLEYGQLKKQLAILHATNMKAYVAGKTDFITACLKQAGLSQGELDQISSQNNVP